MRSISKGSIFRYLVGFSLTIIVFQEALTKGFSDIFSYYDELLVGVFAFISLSLMAIKPRLHEIKVVVLLVVLFVLSALFGRAPLEKATLQLFIHFKMFFIFMFCLRIYNEARWRHILQRCFDMMMFVSLAGILTNIVLQSAFFEIFDTQIQSRGGMVRLLGFQLKPNDLALFLGVYFIHYFFHRDAYRKFFRQSIFAVLVTAAVLLNGSRVGLSAVPIGMFFSATRSAKIKLALGSIAVLAAAYSLFGDYLNYVVTETIANIGEFEDIRNSQYIRGIMIYYGFALAIDYFPIGAGAATFGSILSSGSIVYSELGLMNMQFFQEMQGVYDSNFATIMGEFGLFGLLGFWYVWFELAKAGLRQYEDQPLAKRYVIAISVLAIIVFLTNPFFMYQYNSVIFVVAMIVGPRFSIRQVLRDENR